MSTEGSLDPSLIEQTKQQIRALVAEIAQLAKEDITPEEFYSGFLTRVVSALAAVGGAVWTTNDEGRLALQYQINLQETRLRESEEAQGQHSRLLYKTLSDGEAVILPPHSSGGEDDAGNPTDLLILLGLLKTDLEIGGVVEVFQRPDSGIATQKGYLRFLMQMCEMAGEYLKSHQLRHFSDRQTLWTQLEDFTRVVHASLDPRETAFTIANEGRRLIECDRLSVAIRKGNKCVVEAISGQDVFDKRSNLVRLLNRLATAVVATGDPVWYTGDTRDMAPQVEDAVQEYVDEAHSKTVAILPLKRPEPPEEDDPKKRPEPQPCIGALIVEQIEDSRVAPSMLPRVEVTCKHSSTALANSLEHQSLFLMPVWRAIGHSRWVVKARTLPKTLSITAAIVAVLLFLCLYQTDFLVESKGTLEPVVRQDVFTSVERGIVQELMVEHGDKVAAGQLLVRLRGPEIDLSLEEAEGKLATAEKSRAAKEWELINNRKLTPEDKSRKLSEISELEENIIGLRTQRDILKVKKEDLFAKSPIDGTVVTWHLKDRLTNRPLQMGSVMMRIADLSKEWQLELHMPEQNMGFVEDAQQKLYVKMRHELRKLLLEEKRASASHSAPTATTESAAASMPASTSENSSSLSNAESTVGVPADASNAPVEPVAEPSKDLLAEEVDAELAKIPDSKLHDRWSQFAKTKLNVHLNDILKNFPEAEVKTQPEESSPQPALETPKDDAASEAKNPSGDANAQPVAESPVAEKPKAISSEEAKALLGELLALPDYDRAWEQLSALKQILPDGELKKKLAAIPQETFVDENVTFILATEPGTKLRGRIKEIHRSAEVRGDEGNTVLIKVAIDKSQLSDLRPGAAVTAKVHCGRSSLGYAWLHEVISAIQSKVIFRYF